VSSAQTERHPGPFLKTWREDTEGVQVALGKRRKLQTSSDEEGEEEANKVQKLLKTTNKSTAMVNTLIGRVNNLQREGIERNATITKHAEVIKKLVRDKKESKTIITKLTSDIEVMKENYATDIAELTSDIEVMKENYATDIAEHKEKYTTDMEELKKKYTDVVVLMGKISANATHFETTLQKVLDSNATLVTKLDDKTPVAKLDDKTPVAKLDDKLDDNTPVAKLDDKLDDNTPVAKLDNKTPSAELKSTSTEIKKAKPSEDRMNKFLAGVLEREAKSLLAKSLLGK
jgi:hypothetical protein